MIVNRGGGSFDERTASELQGLFAAAGVEADVRLVAPELLNEAFAEAASAPDLDSVVAAGGDGTISCAAGALAGSGRPLGVLSFGTLNHFARDAGLPADLKEAVAAIAGGLTRSVDVGEVNGRVFVNNSAVGLYPLMVRAREAQQHQLGRSKRLAMLTASLRALYRFSRQRLIIRFAGGQAPVETPLLFVGNNHYDTKLFALGRREAIDRGELCLYAPLARGRFHFVLLALRSLFGRLDQVRDFVHLDGIEAVEVDSSPKLLAVSTDGETWSLETPLRYRIRPGALRLLVAEPPER
ncbi:MAG: diacylglycerol/lipid kinase family protein [Allosphingosinicella sp.]